MSNIVCGVCGGAGSRTKGQQCTACGGTGQLVAAPPEPPHMVEFYAYETVGVTMEHGQPWYEEAIYQLPPEDWERYRGSNHEKFVGYGHTRNCGTTRFSDLIGKPLDRKMWALLVLRWQPRTLWVVYPDDAVWCIHPGSPALTLYVGEDGLVRDVDIRLCHR